MDNELMLKLKEAGFPFSNREGSIKPTLEELIDACGEEFGRLVYNKKYGYIAYPTIEWTGKHAILIPYESTPTEAVARLYLALHTHSQ